MTKKYFNIDEVPAILWGEESDNVYLFVHGQYGSKEDAEGFAKIVCPKGWQVVSFDLPEHGDRKMEKNCFDPWHVVPELKEIMRYITDCWSKVALMGSSIGTWFSMLSFDSFEFERSIFVCPILDMERLILNLMAQANVTVDELKEKKIIPVENGADLSWEYLMYAKDYAIQVWNSPTYIFYAENDEFTARDTADEFAEKFHCKMEVLAGSKHWIHTKEQIEALNIWLNRVTD